MGRHKGGGTRGRPVLVGQPCQPRARDPLTMNRYNRACPVQEAGRMRSLATSAAAAALLLLCAAGEARRHQRAARPPAACCTQCAHECNHGAPQGAGRRTRVRAQSPPRQLAASRGADHSPAPRPAPRLPRAQVTPQRRPLLTSWHPPACRPPVPRCVVRAANAAGTAHSAMDGGQPRPLVQNTLLDAPALGLPPAVLEVPAARCTRQQLHRVCVQGG